MCLTCGCMRPHEDHGNPAHLTFGDLQRSAAADNVSIEDAVHSLLMTIEIARQEADQANQP